MMKKNKQGNMFKVIGMLCILSLAAYLFWSGTADRSKHEVVADFDVNKYCGQWYEIARMDFKFEKDLKQVTAFYSINEDGSVKVTNRGYHMKEEVWKESEGKAKFQGDSTKGALKVSFFGPFYSDYHVVQLDNNYQTALVFGKNTNYLWILSRSKTIPERIKKDYLAYATKHGYDISQLVWTIQN